MIHNFPVERPGPPAVRKSTELVGFTAEVPSPTPARPRSWGKPALAGICAALSVVMILALTARRGTSVAPDEASVRSLLERYRDAYQRLDAAAAKTVWPSVDEQLLARAFFDLDSQSLTFENCRIDVSNARSVASCQGQRTYVTRFGDKSPRTQSRTWTFQLEKRGDQWAIDEVQSRPEE